LRTDVAAVTVRDAPGRLELLEAVRADVNAAGRVAALNAEVGDEFSVAVVLADPDAA
jgi:hypothetical protein